jgi:hypothetical protein
MFDQEEFSPDIIAAIAAQKQNLPFFLQAFVVIIEKSSEVRLVKLGKFNPILSFVFG